MAFGSGFAGGFVDAPQVSSIAVGTSFQQALNSLAQTTGLDSAGAANVWAGTTGLELVGALNAKNGGTSLELAGVLRALGFTVEGP